MNFSDFDFHSLINAGIKALNYKEPTPIQAQAIPPILEGKDLLGIAQTGTGKTAAFVLPILQRLITAPKRPGVKVLVLAPTRELASQIDEAIYDLTKSTGITCAAIYGGVNMNGQRKKLVRGVDIVVACPGRLLDHLRQKNLKLNTLEVLVLDEADQMCDMGFLPDIKKILSHVPRNRQTLLFSATMPENIRLLAEDLLQSPITVKIGRATPVGKIKQSKFSVSQDQKAPLLNGILKQIKTDSVLVFTRTKHRAKRLASQLERAGHSTISLQGNLSQSKRRDAMEGFRKGKYRVMVATDIASRGIDVSSVSHVINFDIPDTIEAYTHRIGRTGRASRSGEAFTFVTPSDRHMVRSIERVIGKSLEAREIQAEAFDEILESKSDNDFRRSERSDDFSDRAPRRRFRRSGGSKSFGPGRNFASGRRRGREEAQAQR